MTQRLGHFFLPFGFLLLILTADPVSFARFLRKRISGLHMIRAFSNNCPSPWTVLGVTGQKRMKNLCSGGEGET